MGNTVTICFANNKGGSGKSTSCSNVGAALAGMGKKVLMVDGDMQLNLSLSFFSEEEVLEMAAGEKNLYYAIGHQSDLSDFIVHTKYENLDLVPSSTLMSSVEISSALRIVDNRCAIVIVVRFFASSSRLFWIQRSLSLSSALVASSKN